MERLSGGCIYGWGGIKWCAWPLYLSQALLPIALLFYPVVPILVTVLIPDAVWKLLRDAFVSAWLASIGATFVQLFKWSIALGCAIYLSIQHRYLAAVVAILWPLVASLFNAPVTLILAWLFGLHGRVVSSSRSRHLLPPPPPFRKPGMCRALLYGS